MENKGGSWARKMKTGGQTERRKGKTERCCSLVWHRGATEGEEWCSLTCFLILSLPSLSATAFPLLSLSPAPHVFCLISSPASVIVSHLLLFAFCHRLVFDFPPLYLCATPRFVVLSLSCTEQFSFLLLFSLSFFPPSCHFFNLLLHPHFITTEQCPPTLQGLVVLYTWAIEEHHF